MDKRVPESWEEIVEEASEKAYSKKCMSGIGFPYGYSSTYSHGFADGVAWHQEFEAKTPHVRSKPELQELHLELFRQDITTWKSMYLKLAEEHAKLLEQLEKVRGEQ